MTGNYPTGNEFDDMCSDLRENMKQVKVGTIYQAERADTEVVNLEPRKKGYTEKIEAQADEIFGPQ